MGLDAAVIIMGCLVIALGLYFEIFGCGMCPECGEGRLYQDSIHGTNGPLIYTCSKCGKKFI